MATKLFKESDSWGELSGNGSSLNFASRKNIKVKDKKKRKKRKHSEISDDLKSEGGKWVKAPAFYGLEDTDVVQQETSLKRKDRKRKHQSPPPSEQIEPAKKIKKANMSDQEKFREMLKGSRFRYINEQLYSTSSQEAAKIFEEDDTAFTAYHEGYRSQLEKWPLNPLDKIINQIKRMPKSHVIVDMGCGDARLEKSVLQKVYSFDLVSDVGGVTKADMANVPIDSNSVHVVVYCLSLMGTNLKDFFIEANRILKLGGVIKIAEVTSRFEKVNDFISFVQKCGFEVLSKDLTNNHFYFFSFKKTHDVNSFNKKIPSFSLKPCLYKKR